MPQIYSKLSESDYTSWPNNNVNKGRFLPPLLICECVPGNEDGIGP